MMETEQYGRIKSEDLCVHEKECLIETNDNKEKLVLASYMYDGTEFYFIKENPFVHESKNKPVDTGSVGIELHDVKEEPMDTETESMESHDEIKEEHEIKEELTETLTESIESYFKKDGPVWTGPDGIEVHDITKIPSEIKTEGIDLHSIKGESVKIDTQWIKEEPAETGSECSPVHEIKKEPVQTGLDLWNPVRVEENNPLETLGVEDKKEEAEVTGNVTIYYIPAPLIKTSDVKWGKLAARQENLHSNSNELLNVESVTISPIKLIFSEPGLYKINNRQIVCKFRETVRELVCLECDKPFTNVGHSKLYSCQLCQFATICICSLSYHRKTTHRIQDQWPKTLVKTKRGLIKLPAIRLLCICGYSTEKTGKMASHLTTCNQGENKCTIIQNREQKANLCNGIQNMQDKNIANIIQKTEQDHTLVKPPVRKIRQYYLPDLEAAVSMVIYGVLNVTKAAKAYGVPRKTVGNRVAKYFRKQQDVSRRKKEIQNKMLS